MKRLFLPMALLCAPFCIGSSNAAPTTCARATLVRGGTVSKVERFGVLALQDGREARLEGIRLPLGKLDRAPEQFARDALFALTSLVKGKAAQLALQPPEQDRYGRLRAQVFIGTSQLWLQQELLRRGLARVEIAPLHPECAKELYAAEEVARAAKRGLWREAAYAVRDANALKRDIDTFQIVQGRVISAALRRGRAYLDFGADWRSDFTVTIAPEDMRTFRAAGIDPLNYEGKTVRVRGITDSFHGPEMAIASPASVEVLNAR